MRQYRADRANGLAEERRKAGAKARRLWLTDQELEEVRQFLARTNIALVERVFD